MKTPVGKAVGNVLKPVGSGSGTARPSVRVQDRIRKNQAGMEAVELMVKPLTSAPVMLRKLVKIHKQVNLQKKVEPEQVSLLLIKSPVK